MRREETSTRLRHSERIAELCGFEYDRGTNKYGGFFTVYQLEKVMKVIETLKAKNEELSHEVAMLLMKGGKDGDSRVQESQAG